MDLFFFSFLKKVHFVCSSSFALLSVQTLMFPLQELVHVEVYVSMAWVADRACLHPLSAAHLSDLCVCQHPFMTQPEADQQTPVLAHSKED